MALKRPLKYKLLTGAYIEIIIYTIMIIVNLQTIEWGGIWWIPIFKQKWNIVLWKAIIYLIALHIIIILLIIIVRGIILFLVAITYLFDPKSLK